MSDISDKLKHGKVTMMKQADMLKCPHEVIMPEHYRADGTCKCNDRAHRDMMIKEWEYTEGDFAGIELIS